MFQYLKVEQQLVVSEGRENPIRCCGSLQKSRNLWLERERRNRENVCQQKGVQLSEVYGYLLGLDHRVICSYYMVRDDRFLQ
jgi:hypothetical protein